jgi:hypothetical protein
MKLLLVAGINKHLLPIGGFAWIFGGYVFIKLPAWFYNREFYFIGRAGSGSFP